MPPNEVRFWEMVGDLVRLNQTQSDLLFERMFILDWELQVEKLHGFRQ